MTAPKDKDRIPDELIDQLLSGYKKPEDLTGESGILKQLTARLIERAMQAEMTEHLGYEKHAPEGRGAPNSRNGTRAKTLRTDHGELEIEVPPRRAGDATTRLQAPIPAAPAHERLEQPEPERRAWCAMVTWDKDGRSG